MAGGGPDDDAAPWAFNVLSIRAKHKSINREVSTDLTNAVSKFLVISVRVVSNQHQSCRKTVCRRAPQTRQSYPASPRAQQAGPAEGLQHLRTFLPKRAITHTIKSLQAAAARKMDRGNGMPCVWRPPQQKRTTSLPDTVQSDSDRKEKQALSMWRMTPKLRRMRMMDIWMDHVAKRIGLS